jgi:hypothetical protein
MKKYTKSIASLFITGLFLFMAFGSDESKSSETKSTNIEEKKQEQKCNRCGGSGYIATYGAYGCKHMSHFASSPCGSDSHTSDCISSGSKTCPCCHGTGK